MANKTSSKEIALGINRRRFIYYSALAATAAAFPGCMSRKVNYKSPNEKLNVGGIGISGKGASDIEGPFLLGENIVAICDVDENSLNKSAQKYTSATKYRDYRKMIEQHKDLDAIVVSTPDHQHYPATMMAIKLGKHVYCQKPLTHTIWEARKIAEATKKYKVATQMGNQGHSHEGNRRLCELIWAGAIGEIREVHCWTNRPVWPQGMNRPAGSDPVPSSLDWDLWIGPAPMRPYKGSWGEQEVGNYKRAGGRPVYHAFSWRGWWDFGCGALGDMGCHVLDGANWALDLSEPDSVEAIENNGSTSEMAPKSSIIRYEFPRRSRKMPALTLTWYDGDKRPAKPAELVGKELPESGTIFVGSKGKIVADTYGMNLSLLPEAQFKDYVAPPAKIPRIPDNNPYLDWVRACKGGPKACSNFEVAGPFTEMVLLGNLALRIPKKLEWDAKRMRVKNAPEAAQYINKQYRAGWEV